MVIENLQEFQRSEENHDSDEDSRDKEEDEMALN